MAVSSFWTGLRVPVLSPLAALTALWMLGACSAPPGAGEDDDDGPQLEAYGGPLSPNQPSSANPTGNGSNNGAPAGTGNGSTSEGNPSGVQLGTGNTGTGNTGTGNTGTGNTGTGNTGTGQVGAVNPAPGAGGAPGAMAGSAGSGALPPQNNPPPNGAAGSANMPGQPPVPQPPVQPPVQPPPVQPPPVQPETPFVGAGCDGNAFFCEDFEGFNVGAVQANADFTPTGNVTIDSAVARGNRSLHIQTQGNGRSVISLAGFAPPNNSFFARMYVQATAFPTAPDYAHFTLVEATGTGAGFIRPIGGQYIPGMGTLWGAGSDGGPTGDWTNWRPSAPVEAGRFLCIEWEMNSADNNINVWIDSVAKTDLSVSTKSHGGSGVDFVFPRFNNLTIGWQLYQGGSTPNQFSLWYDDIVFSTRRVGCAQ